jgi:thioredoxin-like negative regulator of GroEL
MSPVLIQAWDDLVPAMKRQNQPVTIAKVDCMTNSAICTKWGVHKFPSFVGFISGEKIGQYDGSDRSFEALLDSTTPLKSMLQFVLDKVETIL